MGEKEKKRKKDERKGKKIREQYQCKRGKISLFSFLVSINCYLDINDVIVGQYCWSSYRKRRSQPEEDRGRDGNEHNDNSGEFLSMGV